ncbi:glycoside hydrolase family 3 C-terminal domain-containing protein [Microcella humidisoli]|uniref:Glycoside hydrolase family 3 C-terminal domain-containing protein n=1 Tax=Microcella humidisoli TaxID=2963406 RepID=A0ABY5FTE3_9MICO|nr:glycoside hydrolase family 3 C-terminal domain-containing protein [Microcella humidisoli]UTT61559.1 glycoside hydrolase family 3 C-terminal domain-containing protein [Microcella humidisoli]
MTTRIDATSLSTDEQLSLLSGADFWRTRALPEHGIPAAMLADGPHGLRAQLEATDHLGLASSVAATCFPPAATLASSWDERLVQEVGAAVGREARALGVDVVLGPGMNIKRHPLCGRNFEYSSEDPLLSGLLAASAVRGIQSAGVGACLKHFAVNNQEHRRFVIDAIVDERTLHELYLRGFEIAVRASAPRMVMAAYNRINGDHATDARWLLTETLRERWGFDGVVVSDWGATADRPAAVTAGMDLEMPGGAGTEPAMRAALAAGTLDPADVARSAQRVIDLAVQAQDARAHAAPTMAELLDPHDALARRAAASSSVVLTNHGILPLQPGARVALIGAFAEHPRYQGSGSSLVTPTRLTTAREALEAAGVVVDYAPGYEPVRSAADAALIDEAVAVARDADIAIVMVGLPGIAESEGFDRDTLALPAQHDALVAAVAAVNPRTVVALSVGAPVLLPWRDDVAAILLSSLGGQASGGALADALLGIVEPAGRLAETWPAAQSDVAADPFFPGDDAQVHYREGLFVGYRHATTAGVSPAFAFGHGLGYGSSEWVEARASAATLAEGGRLTLTVEVTNTGPTARSELVQVYARDRSGVVLRPRRELVGFARAMLAPGETRSVEVEVAAEALRYWDVRVHDWALPRGPVDLEVARSSETIEAVLAIEVLGTASDSAEPPSTAPIAASDEQWARRLGRAIPTPAPARPFTRESTLGDIGGTLVGRTLRSAVVRMAPVSEEDRRDPASLALIERSIDELPLRGLAQMSQGKMSWAVVDAVVAAANRRPLAAVGALLRRR